MRAELAKRFLKIALTPALSRKRTEGNSSVPQDSCIDRHTMTIKSDKWIRRMAADQKMIEPFEPGQVKTERRPSPDLVRHVELRLRRALRR